jgi:predicted DNA-binding transcriptional regulator AlpA
MSNFITDPIPPDAPERLTLDQVAAYFGCSLRSVRRWIKDGFLPRPHSLTRRVLFWETAAVRQRLAEHMRLQQGGYMPRYIRARRRAAIRKRRASAGGFGPYLHGPSAAEGGLSWPLAADAYEG